MTAPVAYIPDWTARFVERFGGGYCPDPLFICPRLEWHSREDAIYRQPIRFDCSALIDEDPRGWWLTLHFLDAPVNLIMWWRGWHYPHRDQRPGVKEFHLSSMCFCVGEADPPNGLQWREAYQTRNCEVARFDRTLQTIARVIEDGYTYMTLCAALWVTDIASRPPHKQEEEQP